MPSISRILNSFLTLQSPLSPLDSIDDGALSYLEQAPLKPSTQFSCLPSQSCWPSADKWRSLNKTLDGRLQVTQPWAHPCFVDSSSQECKEVQKGYTNAISREAVYGAMQNLKWETCAAENCQLNPLSPGDDVSGTCKLGRVSPYYVNATDHSHVVATVNFVKEHGIRLSIKNSGHDYFGRSAAANSLALWTHHMKNLEFHQSFILSNCKDAPELENIGVMGAGVEAGEAFTYFERFGMQITVGAAASVGVAGGFGLAGGHGPLAPTYGLMVDQAVEFDVVTADGKLRTINQCNDPDLFWAMRGGGGSTFGVLTSYKLQLHPELPINVHIVEAEIALNETATTDVRKSQGHRDVVLAMARNQKKWSENGIAGYNFFMPEKFISLQVQPSSDTNGFMALTADWRSFLSNYRGLQVEANSYLTFSNYTSFGEWTTSPQLAKNGLTGVGIAESSRLVPTSLFTTDSSTKELVDAFLEGLQISFKQGAGITSGHGHIYATTPANHPDQTSETSVHPAWRSSLWHVVYPGLYSSNITEGEQDDIFNTVGDAVQPLKKLSPESGCYLNEADWKEPDWQNTFFGSNYKKLLAVKNKYDPNGLFKCWKCVGWEANDDPIFSCYGQSKTKPVPSIPLGPV